LEAYRLFLKAEPVRSAPPCRLTHEEVALLASYFLFLFKSIICYMCFHASAAGL
jgi:hypothetical protein